MVMVSEYQGFNQPKTLSGIETVFPFTTVTTLEALQPT